MCGLEIYCNYIPFPFSNKLFRVNAEFQNPFLCRYKNCRVKSGKKKRLYNFAEINNIFSYIWIWNSNN